MYALDDLFQVSNSMNNSKANLSGSSVEPNDTIYLCNFRVSVDGEWLCLKVGSFFMNEIKYFFNIIFGTRYFNLGLQNFSPIYA